MISMLSDSTIDYILAPFLVHFVSYWSICSIFFVVDYFRLSQTAMSRYPTAIITSIRNQFLVGLPTLCFVSSRTQEVVEQSNNDTFMVCIWKLFLIINMANLLFYWCHRFLHLQFMFYYVHSKHHEFIEPIGAAALYAHPIEHLLANTLSFLLPFLYIGCNYDMMICLLAISSMATVFYHTKSFGMFNEHLIHHQLFKYNYGFGGYIDKFFGTHRA